MKNILYLLTILFVAGTTFAQTITPSISENYVLTKEYIAKDGDTISQPAITSIQYFDGLGRPKQNVIIKATPTGKDIVNHIEYDSSGRQTKEYLPIPQTGSQNGAIYATPLAGATFYGNEKIYGEKILENSPMDRIKQQVQVGNDWALKPVIYEYGTNINNEVKNIRVQTLQLANGSEESYLAKGSFYLAGTLMKNIIIGEDGDKTIEFKDRTGKLVLIRKVLNMTENQDTYYIYNNHKQLVFVTPPLASKKITELPGPTFTQIPADIINDLCYQYKYDGRNRLVEKKLPGKGWEYMLYDKQDRLVATQDANLEANGQWLYTKYDQFGRVAITGIGTGDTRSVEQSIVDGLGSNNVNRVSAPFFNRQGMDVCFGNPDNTYPNSTKWVTLLSLNYYDTYPAGSPVIPTQILGQNILSQDAQNSNISTKSLPVASYVKNIEDDNWTKNYIWYDQKGRPIGSHSINHLGGYTKTESLLDFSGAPLQAITKHKRLDSDTERVITENFTYDHQNRLLTHTHQIDSNPLEYLAQNDYNELSQLKTKKVGGSVSGNSLQTVDYKYNIRGWMTQINNPADLSGGDLFGYEIKYTNPENTGLSTGRFNGNIAEIDWKTSTNPNDNKRRYSYTYDALNRLQQGVYSEPGSSLISNDYYNEQLTYDLNGNIATLKRFSKPSSGTTAEKIDDLIYNYTGNRLDKITLPIGVVNNYSGYNALQNVITYDSNGNMIKHLDKGISSIDYNYFNLPSKILTSPVLFANTYQLYYNYRADGQKINKKYVTSQMDVVGNWETIELKTDYLDGFQYSQNNNFGSVSPMSIQFVPTQEGYFDFVKNKYIYNYTDHLGNVRLSYQSNGSSIEVLEENNYYPFGLKHEGYNALTGNPSYQYKYNGKELQETGMYDYGARFYMPDIGRWGVVDPLAETSRRFSPYTYAYNNPINFIDPDGREGTGWGLKDNEWKFVDGMQKGDAAYQQGGYTDFRADGSVEPNVEITNSTAENTGMTYLGFNGETSYMPADSNGSAGMLGLSNWFRDAISAITPNFNSKEEFPQITNPSGMARTDFDASTHDKLRPGDKTFTLDWGSFVVPSTFPANGSKDVPTWAGRIYAGSWVTDRMADIFNLNKGSGTDTLFMKATFVGSGKDFLRDTMFAEPYRKNETYEQVKNRQNKKYDSVKTNSKIFLTR